MCISELAFISDQLIWALIRKTTDTAEKLQRTIYDFIVVKNSD